MPPSMANLIPENLKPLYRYVSDEAVNVERMGVVLIICFAFFRFLKNGKHFKNLRWDKRRVTTTKSWIFSTHELNITKRIKIPNSEDFYEPNSLEGLISGIGNIKRFIDRNPQYFNYILEYLRSKQQKNDFDLPNDSKISQSIIKAAKFYHVEGLIELTDFLRNNKNINFKNKIIFNF